MNVAVATNNFTRYFQRYFPDLKIIGTKEGIPDKLDLLILTGGEDISPELYGDTEEGSYGCNLDRDKNEIDILILCNQKFRDLKVLGVCRGHQFINVFLGGTLIQDIDSIDKHHPGVHKLVFKDEKHPLAWLTTVNSLHHQAIRHTGHMGDESIIATEPVTGLAEIVQFRNRYFGVQFHPEFFEPEIGNRFFNIIKNWVSGEIEFKDEPPVSKFKYSTMSWSINSSTTEPVNTLNEINPPPQPPPGFSFSPEPSAPEINGNFFEDDISGDGPE